MPILGNGTHIEIQNGIIVYDGITRPEALDPKPGQAPGMKWNVKILVAPTSPDLPALEQLAQQELANSPFKGVLPRGGNMPIGTAGPNEFNGMFTGYAVINCSTFRQPDVRDENGRQMSPQEYGPLFFNGQHIDVVVHCAAYDNVSKGVAARLDGIRVRASENAERLNIGGGGFDVGSVWGGGQAQPQQQAPAQGQPQQQWGQQPQQQAPAQGQPQQQWGQQPQQQAPAQGQQQWGQQPQQQAPAQGQQQWGQQPQQQAPAPQQNNSWMPQQ